MTNEEKLKSCVIPSCELREVAFHKHDGSMLKKIQQMHFNYDGTAFVWRDIKSVNIRMFDEFSKTVMFE